MATSFLEFKKGTQITPVQKQPIRQPTKQVPLSSKVGKPISGFEIFKETMKGLGPTAVKLFAGGELQKFDDDITFGEKTKAFFGGVPSAAKDVAVNIVKAPLRVAATIVQPWVDFAYGVETGKDKPLEFPIVGEVPTIFHSYNRAVDSGYAPLEAGLLVGAGTATDLAISAGMAKFFTTKIPIKVGKGELVGTVKDGKPGKMAFGEPLKNTKPIMKEAQYMKLGADKLVEIIPTTAKTFKINAYNVSQSSFENIVGNIGGSLKKIGITYNKAIPQVKSLVIPEAVKSLVVGKISGVGPVKAPTPILPSVVPGQIQVPMATIPKELQPLIEEAKKYDTVEEFKKNNDLIFQGVGEGKETAFFTDNIEAARMYANQKGLKGTGEIRVSRYSDLSDDAKTFFSDDLSMFSDKLAKELIEKGLVDRPLSKKEYFDIKGEITTHDKLPVIGTLKSTQQLTDIYNQAKGTLGQAQIPGLKPVTTPVPVGGVKTPKLTPADKLRLAGETPATLRQIKTAHVVARDKLLLTDQGKVKPQYRKLAEGITGKKSVVEMTSKQAEEFINALDKLETRLIGGERKPPVIPTTQKVIVKDFFDRQFKKPSLIAKYITPKDRYARSLGVYDLIEPSINAKRALQLERTEQFKNLNKIGQAIRKLEGVTIKEKAGEAITKATPKAFQKWYNLLDKYATSKDAGLIGEPAKIFDELRSLTTGMLERVNEIRAKAELAPINNIKGYVTHITDLATKKALLRNNEMSEVKKYWADFIRSKHIFNPTAIHRTAINPDELLRDPIKALKVMVSVDLKQIYLEQPIHLYREQIQALQDTIPASTRRWVDDYINITIRGRATKLDELTNESLDKIGVRKVLDTILAPFGRTTDANLIKQMAGGMSRVIHDAVIWGKLKLVLRNHTQKFLGLGLYGVKPFVKASFPSAEAKDIIKSSDFWKISNKAFTETSLGLGKGIIKKLEKIGYAPYSHSHISNVTHTMKTAFHAAKELVDNPKYSKYGWTMEDVKREMDFGAQTAQYSYNSLSMPEIFNSGIGKVFGTLQSWWMNYTTNYWREMLVRGFHGRTGWGKPIPPKWRLASLRHIITSLVFIEAMRRAFDIDYRQTALLAVLPTYLSPPGQILMGLYKYLTADSEYTKNQAVRQMKYSWSAFLPGSGAWREWKPLWEGEKTLKETLFKVEQEEKSGIPSI